MTIERIQRWLEDKRLRMRHAATLARFEKQLYDHKDNTLTAIEAFNKGLLSPQALLSPLLATQVSSFTNIGMLTVWNEVSLQFKRQHGHAHPGEIPLNNILLSATFQGDTEKLDWLVQLKNPAQALRWDASHLLTHDLKTAHWAMMWHKDLLNTDDPHAIVHASLSGTNFISRSWLDQVDKPNTSYESSRGIMHDVQAHAHNFRTSAPCLPRG